MAATKRPEESPSSGLPTPPAPPTPPNPRVIQGDGPGGTPIGRMGYVRPNDPGRISKMALLTLLGHYKGFGLQDNFYTDARVADEAHGKLEYLAEMPQGIAFNAELNSWRPYIFKHLVGRFPQLAKWDGRSDPGPLLPDAPEGYPLGPSVGHDPGDETHPFNFPSVRFK